MPNLFDLIQTNLHNMAREDHHTSTQRDRSADFLAANLADKTE